MIDYIRRTFIVFKTVLNLCALAVFLTAAVLAAPLIIAAKFIRGNNYGN